MAYATQDDLCPQRLTQTQLVQLTDDSTPPQAVNATIVSNALDEASGVVDSYCRSRYVTPLQQSEVVKSWTLDIATFKLMARRGNVRIRQIVQDTYNSAIAALEKVRSGEESLDQPLNATAQSTGPGALGNCGNPRFNDCNISGFC